MGWDGMGWDGMGWDKVKRRHTLLVLAKHTLAPWVSLCKIARAPDGKCKLKEIMKSRKGD